MRSCSTVTVFHLREKGAKKQYQVSRKLEFWGRIARTTYYDRTEIGTGLEKIDGNKLTNIKLQLRYKLQ